MTDFSVRFEMPRHGWMGIALSDGSEHLELAVSRIPLDSLQQLVLSLSSVLAQKPFSSTLCYLEPEEYHFEFKTTKGVTFFQVNEPMPYEKVKTHFELEMPSFELVLAFWRGLRCIQAQIFDNEFQKEWGYPFPDKELQQLTEALREAKRKQQ